MALKFVAQMFSLYFWYDAIKMCFLSLKNNRDCVVDFRDTRCVIAIMAFSFVSDLNMAPHQLQTDRKEILSFYKHWMCY